MSAFEIPNVPAGAVDLVLGLFSAIIKAVKAGDDQEKLDEAAMDAAEAAKKYQDRRKFGSGPPPSEP